MQHLFLKAINYHNHFLGQQSPDVIMMPLWSPACQLAQVNFFEKKKT